MHIIAPRLAVIISVCVGLTVVLFACCDRENPFKPPPDADTTDYKVYFNDAEHLYTYFAYHTATKSVDSFTLPYPSDRGFAISPDGKTMYLNTGTSIAVIDLDSLVVLDERPINVIGYMVTISPDGQYLAVMEPELAIVQVCDFSTIFYDDGYSGNGIFSADSKTFYCATFDSGGYLFAHKISLSNTITADTIYFPGGDAWRIVPNRSQTTWFLFLWVRLDYFIFRVYDPLVDSTLFDYLFAPGHGDMLITPDGRYVVFSQPGRLNSDVPAPSYFTVFDVAANRIADTVSVRGIADGTNPTFMPIGELCITPNGRHLVGLGFGGGLRLFDYDLTRKKYQCYHFLGWDKYPTDLTCQSSP